METSGSRNVSSTASVQHTPRVRPARYRLVRGGADAVVSVEDLDESQRAAVTARGQVVRVLGAPGSGKTTVAAHSVLDRVASGRVRPHETLVLAPTRVAAARLRHSLSTLLAATTSSPLVCSMQAFAYGVLRAEAAERGDPAPRLLSGPEQDVVLRELLAGHAAGFGRRPPWPTDLAEATRTRGFRAELRDLLMRAVEHGLDADALAALAERENNAVWRAAAQVLAEYDEVTALSTPGGYDPAWILTAAADLLVDDPHALERVHGQTRVVVVDDAQELTAPAARLLRVIRTPANEVVLIGDPDAATQTFRGADPHLMMADEATQTRALTRSWRMPVTVSDAAARVCARIGSVGSVAHRLGAAGSPGGDGSVVTPPATSVTPSSAGTPHQPTLFDLDENTTHDASQGVEASAPESESTDERETLASTSADSVGEERSRTPGRVETAVLPTATAEARFVAARLREAHLLHGVPYSRMAVVVRGAGRSATLRRVLSGDGIPVDVPGARVPLRDEPAVRPFLQLFELVLTQASRSAQGDEQIETATMLIPAMGGTGDALGQADIPPRPEDVELGVEMVFDLLASPLGATDSLAVRRLLRSLRQAEARRIAQDECSQPRTTDELLVACMLGDALLDAVDPGAPTAGLRRIRDVFAAGCAAARIENGRWAAGVTAEVVLWQMWASSALAEPWRRAALAGSQRADRDLDAVVALTDAAARYVDRLPQRGPDGFLEHVRGQDVAGDTLVARAPADDCVTLTTPAGAAGLEWDLVVVAGVQEGVWPDLRLRGSVLGSATLVDTLTGRGTSAQAARSAVRSDETRLFHVAITRTRDTLLCTAVRNDDESPSPFLDLVDPPDGQDGQEGRRRYAKPPLPMTPADLVADLRRRLSAATLEGGESVVPGTSGEGTVVTDEARAAAALLARLADAGVPGAHPDEWWGLREVSDDRPRRDPSGSITVSPSKVEAFAQCELRWLLAGSGGRPGGGTTASSLGTLIHDIAATIDNGDHGALVAELDRRWPELDLPPGWTTRALHDKAMSMLDRLHRQHNAALSAGWQVVGTEIDVRVPLGRAVVRGRVDRLERDEQGRLRVVDLKTGSSKPAAADLPTHPQLGAYQVAVEEGAFGDLGTESAGAALMQIGKGGQARGALQEQQPLATAEDPRWAHTLLEQTAEGMAGATYRARAGSWCRLCESRFSCPLQPEGEHLR